MTTDFITGDFQPLLKRKLTEDTCRKFGYKVGQGRHGPVQIAEYRDDSGQLVAQHVRGADKAFTWVGDAKEATLWGKWLWRSGGTRVVITEGEIDAMSVSQVFNNGWAVVSIPNGAQAAKKAIQKDLEWLEGFASVVLMFDMDEPGQAAMAECAPLFTPGKCKIASLPHKDANEMLKLGLVRELTSAVYEARTYRPDGIVSLGEIRERVLATPETGLPYPFPSVTVATFGRQWGQVIGLGAGSGVGKTDLITQSVEFDINTLGLTVGVLMLEQDVGETGKRIAGKAAHRRFHIPDGSWTQDELIAAWDALEATGRLHLYDAWGATDWDTVRVKIRYMATALGVKSVYLDHLTALVAHADDERRALEGLMADMAGMAKSLGIIITYVSHLATPETGSHEEGARVAGRHFKGSRSIIQWTHMLWGLERNTQASDPEERRRATLRCLKDRFTGNANGMTFGLAFNPKTGILEECAQASESGFEDETGGVSDF